MATLHLDVATPDGLALHTEAESVAAPSIAGEFGVLPGHLPLLAATKAGLLKYRVGGKDEIAAVGPGFVEALPDKVLLLTDAFLKPSQIDRAKAESELAEAEKALAEFKGLV
ncbi:MAG TPA: ATP synthase F1 subunit epsilon, partial [Polyangiales bacterium]